jgi:RNA polymerase sigma-70 factor (ECF subfamily)
VAERFETTQWSLVLAAAQGAEGSREALEWLCATYWYPLYAFVRRHTHDAEASRDLTQSFFLSLIDGDSLRRIDPAQGRFRAFLLASIKHFLANERARTDALKRRADNPAFQLPLDGAEARYLADSASGLDPEQVFETRWALAVFDRALRRLGEEHESSGKGALFRRLSGCLTGDDGGSYEGIAQELAMTDGALRVAVHRMRRRLGALLRKEVVQTVASPAEVDGEIRNLLLALGRAT